MSYNEDKVDEAALALMHLVKHRRRKGPLRAWKGLDWDILDRLHEKGYISDPKSKTKSVVMTEEGAEKSAELFEELFVDEESTDSEEGEETDQEQATDDDRVIDPRWRERDWPAPSNIDELQVVELSEADLSTLRWGMDDNPETAYLDVEAGEADTVFAPDPWGEYATTYSDDPSIEEGQEKLEELESDDRYIIIPEEETQDAWQRMRDFIDFVTEDAFRELLENAVHGKGAFRRFKDALCRRAGARDLWFEYDALRRNHQIRDFLAGHGYRIVVMAEEDG